MTDISTLARIAYETGIDPIDYAEGQIKILIDVHLLVATSRAQDPATFPGFPADLTVDALSRRILGELLDAGWHPPVWPIPGPEPEAEPEPMPVGPVRVVPRLVIDRDELGFACLEADCPGCGATALIVNEWDAAECLSCTWREFEPPQEAS